MVNKLISVGALVCMLGILLLAQTELRGPLSSFISLEAGVSAGRALLIAAMIGLAFKKSIRDPLKRNGLMLLGLTLTAFGAAGMAVPALDYALIDYLKYLDMLLITQAGVMFIAVALDKELVNQPKPKQQTSKVKVPAKIRTKPA